MGIGVQEVPELIMTSAEASCRAHGTEATHWTISALDSSMILLNAIVIRHNSGDATSNLRSLGLLAVSSGDRDRGVGSTFGGQAGVSDELRARVIIWPPLRPTW